MNMAGFSINNFGLFGGSSGGSSGNWMSNLLSMTADYNSIRSGAQAALKDIHPFYLLNSVIFASFSVKS